ALRQLAVHSVSVGGPGAPEPDWAAPMDAAKASLAGIGSISVVDRDGIIRHSTQPVLVAQMRRDDYIFRRLRDEDVDRLAIDTPILSLREPRTYLVPLGRRLLDEHGRF